jgi:hypothetical protein
MLSAGKRVSEAAALERERAMTSTKRRNDHYTVGLGVEENPEKRKKRQEEVSCLDDEPIFQLPQVHGKKLEKGEAAMRRTAIEYVFSHICGDPPEDTWLREGVVSGIMHHLRIPAGSSAEVKKVMADILAAKADSKTYDTHAGPKERGAKPLIDDETPQAAVVYRALESNISTTQTTIVVNEWRAGRNLPPISYSAVQGFVQRSDVIHRSRRLTKKSGKDDEGSLWAQARVAECTQFLEQLRLGRLPADCKEVLDSIAKGLLPLHPAAIAWWDENHKKVVLGFTSKHENRIARNPFDQQPTSVKFGDVLPPKKPQTAIKFPEEGRGCFGYAMVERGDGTQEGVKAEPYDYTGKWVVGVKQWEEMKEAELQRVKKLGGV